jgi:type I restriction enzyme R subunit
MGTAYMPIISGQHADELLAREQSWGSYRKPEDYLDSFTTLCASSSTSRPRWRWWSTAPKTSPASSCAKCACCWTSTATPKPACKAAWRNRSNQDIAASIIGYIRQAALGEALLPFEQRVAQAMQRIQPSAPGRPCNANGSTAWPSNCTTKWSSTPTSSTAPSRPDWRRQAARS